MFYDIQSGATGADGTITFPRVLAGGFSVSATDPVTLLGGSANGSVAVGATASVTVSLQPAGAVLGHVFAPSGSPSGGVPVRLSNYALIREVTSGADGSFRFNAVPLGTYTLEAVPNGRLRARETGINVARNGDVVIRDLTLVGLGTVVGHVLNPDHTVAPTATLPLADPPSSVAGSVAETVNAPASTRGKVIVPSAPVAPDRMS